jgi:hypothetical protein
MEVEPDSRNVQCDGCSERWSVRDTNFYCACGWQFSAADVDHAIGQIIFSARLLARLIDQHNDEIARIRSQGRESFHSWLNGIAQRFGGKLGAVMGHVVGAVVRMFF